MPCACYVHNAPECDFANHGLGIRTSLMIITVAQRTAEPQEEEQEEEEREDTSTSRVAGRRITEQREDQVRNAFICPDHHSCSDEVWDRRDTRQSLSWSDRGCFCDAECRRYGDCCRDADALKDEEEEGEDTGGENEEAGTETPLRLTAVGEDTEEGKEQEEEEEELECRSAPTLSSLGSTSADEENWYMMSACPREFDRYDNKVRCEVPSSASEDPLSALPVTSVTSNTTYSSLYCAMCHNDTADIAFWQLALRCPDIKANEPTQRQLLDRLRRTRTGWGLELDSGRRLHCELIARPPTTVRARPCRAPRNHCPRSSPLHEACGNHTAVVYVAGQAFRNVYCAQCAGARPAQVTCSAPCASPQRPADIGGLRMRLTIAPGEDERCGETEIRDPFSRRCRSVICSRPGYDVVDGECVRTARDEDEVEDDREDREDGEEPGQLTDPEDNFLPAEGLLDTENAIEVELEEALAQAAAVEGEDQEEEAPEVELAELLAAEATTEAEDEQQGSGEAAEAVEDEDEEKETDA
ncbi:hypothetical protein FJT64_003127 [Amphibalanus amphitrite]|uniref:SMB domain-containing protein n=1 Tax=Amphibalanus amphitrite TaxID=1232801 RepID=A0A6A4WCH8_AMPAM|nr:hypothetical protein FJT64_003127 [Amphibalanus amphitrite]